MGHAALAAPQGNRNKNKPLPRRRATKKRNSCSDAGFGLCGLCSFSLMFGHAGIMR